MEWRFVKSGDDEVTTIVRDITERRRDERLIAEQQARLVMASKLSTLGEMSAGVAHEINNPLAVIQAAADFLKLQTKSGEVSAAAVEDLALKIKKNTLRISNIIRGLRNFARDSDADPFREYRVADLFSDALELCRERITSHGVALHVAEVPDLALECQPTKLLQVLLNLLNNAHDAVLGLGSSERVIKLVAESLGGEIRIMVGDSGVGIAPELAEKVYQPFFTTKAVGMGTGLGLSISKGIVEDHHGRLSHIRDQGMTIFCITIPKHQPRSGSGRTAA